MAPPEISDLIASGSREVDKDRGGRTLNCPPGKSSVSLSPSPRGVLSATSATRRERRSRDENCTVGDHSRSMCVCAKGACKRGALLPPRVPIA